MILPKWRYRRLHEHLHCDHEDSYDISEVGSGFKVEKCKKCGLVRYWKLAGIAPEGQEWLQPISPRDVPARWRYNE